MIIRIARPPSRLSRNRQKTEDAMTTMNASFYMIRGVFTTQKTVMK
jgi:hypothetical protein